MQSEYSFKSHRTSVVIVQPSGNRRNELEQLVLACASVVVAFYDPESDWKYSEHITFSPPDFLLADITSISDRTIPVLNSISEYLNGYGTQAIIWMAPEALDTAYAMLPVSQCHFLLDAHDFEAMPILAGGRMHMKMQGLKQQDRETDYGALHKISDELADFARTLARIAEQDEPADSFVNDKPVSFRPAPAAMFDSLATQVLQATSPSSEASEIRSILKLRRKRDAYFKAELFADPAWDILLDLYAARLEGKKVSVSSLCIAASVPPTTALRWISAMTEDGLLLREHDPDDARRVFIRLSDSATESLKSYFAETKSGHIMPI